MDKAIGLVEYKTTASGISAADSMVKTAEVEIISSQTVCPGKYIILLKGKLSAVNSAIEKGIKDYAEKVIDSFILGNPHDDIFYAINGTSKVDEFESIGIIETFSAASAIIAADAAAKAAKVNLIEIRLARGMCGKSYLILSGELAAVEAAIDAGSKVIGETGMLLDKSIIARPDKKIWERIV
ncbi:BMC domain-containing protein [Caloramator sp. E03]|uniref:BMC domain-containing protein n=1 Tax=Caloramator sp. E03 TaxID=2576307 RepID=UPI00111095D2|nr:BMC domain-containing protein [Caloramator sp. E03]QCX33962.1 BMC domain-containing protein [Caloramator sp. E03]